MNYNDIKSLAGTYNDSLLATDYRFRRAVQIIHIDGTVLFKRDSFLIRKEQWVIVFSEHDAFKIYDQDDLHCAMEFDPIRTEIELML